MADVSTDINGHSGRYGALRGVTPRDKRDMSHPSVTACDIRDGQDDEELARAVDEVVFGAAGGPS